jgi:hypothetical protein
MACSVTLPNWQPIVAQKFGTTQGSSTWLLWNLRYLLDAQVVKIFEKILCEYAGCPAFLAFFLDMSYAASISQPAFWSYP